MNRTVIPLMIAALALGCFWLGASVPTNSDVNTVVHTEAAPEPAACAITGLGVKLCGSDLLAWCDTTRDFDGILPAADEQACTAAGAPKVKPVSDGVDRSR